MIVGKWYGGWENARQEVQSSRAMCEGTALIHLIKPEPSPLGFLGGVGPGKYYRILFRPVGIHKSFDNEHIVPSEQYFHAGQDSQSIAVLNHDIPFLDEIGITRTRPDAGYRSCGYICSVGVRATESTCNCQ